MFWADRIAGEIEKKFGLPAQAGKTKKPLLIRDEKTVSGRVHVGSMRGAAIHGVVHEVLIEKGVPNSFTWEHNDFDPMDDIPVYLDRAVYEEHLGKPLYTIPSPDPSAKNFGEYFAKEFQTVIEATGWHPQFVWASELYLSGKMDGVIREALEHTEDIRRIQKEISGADRKPGVLPISVICAQCGKMSTTEATDFDGETVMVNCYPTKVEWTKGCGFAGRVSPFGGRAKLYWKADWPAKWKVYGVTVEGEGKDHSTRGGSRDVANHISREVFNYEPPFDIPYEFLLVGGKKMSSSKGRGSSAKEIAALVPPKILRLALLGKDINQQFNFDPEGDTIPVLYDLYDKLAEGYWAGVQDDYARLFELIHPRGTANSFSPAAGHRGDASEKKFAMPRFSQVAFVVQMPHLDISKEFPDVDPSELAERAVYAKKWLEAYAPEKFIFKLQDTLPDVAKNLNDVQKQALKTLADFIASSPTMRSGDELHQKLHESKEFKAVYLAFLGKDHGPKAGWFLSVLDRDFVLKRLTEASK
ncbi:MAG: lysine--tRNA ligase [bacterium]|nr:lysine--tRNA ligase [bacterium]